jgi:hypothetical protein
MNWAYVIQDKEGQVCAATFEQSKAIELCKEFGLHTTYRSIPFYSCNGTEIIVIAGPIPKEYLLRKY